MTLRTTATCMKINKRPVDPDFEDIRIGDRVEFSCPLGDSYETPYVRCVIPRTKKICKRRFDQIAELTEYVEFTDDSDKRHISEQR